MPEQPSIPGPPVGKLPPAPAPAPGAVVVYEKATGKALTCAYAIDARELVASGEYQREPPSAEEKAAASSPASPALPAEAEAAKEVVAVEPAPAVAEPPEFAAAPAKKRNARKRG